MLQGNHSAKYLDIIQEMVADVGENVNMVGPLVPPNCSQAYAIVCSLFAYYYTISPPKNMCTK